MRTKLACAAAVLTLAVLAAPARATPNFPPEIHNHLGLSYTPQCAICHANGVTGLGTVTTPFGQSMRGAGLVANDTTSLDNALDTLAAEHVSSVGDCVPDIEKLKEGLDPNVAAPDAGTCDAGTVTRPGGAAHGELPRYGCGAQIAPGAPAGASGAIGGCLALLAGLLRRRRSVTSSAAGAP